MRQTQYFHPKKVRTMNGPTAAVIKYDNNQEVAPTIIAQGSGQVAKRIIELAQQNNIQMQEDESLIGTLLNIDLGESVPPQLYAAIAEILLLLEEIEKKY
ncbi:EscU/YscU/HrcU family type III secretion system export apparatus switch protein [Peribacillus huizhouensis]|uniref:Flagellar biosynthesis protein n=1 Tax=Peribacillus huizhouensis TaxID=1501239 RepID=A0ABR6CNW6_9BACI|nr:EscU/YscU/HrcU family type III secretion system export apparatus switch protein [Peribacillus huizhouensis]MBA9026744.1 flagellar biosynthesis protein [Peribacillus huizhouensis]